MTKNLGTLVLFTGLTLVFCQQGMAASFELSKEPTEIKEKPGFIIVTYKAEKAYDDDTSRKHRKQALKDLKKLGAREAIELVKGLHVQSNTTISNFQTVKDEMKSQASGVIDNTKVIGKVSYYEKEEKTYVSATIQYTVDKSKKAQIQQVSATCTAKDLLDSKKYEIIFEYIAKNNMGLFENLVNECPLVLEMPNKYGSTPLREAVGYENMGMVKFILMKLDNTPSLNKQMLINKGNDRGYTPMHSTARAKNGEFISLLFKHGADLNQKNERGNTPMHVTIDHNRYGLGAILSAVQKLVKLGALTHLKNNDGYTPLMLTISEFFYASDDSKEGYLNLTTSMVNMGVDAQQLYEKTGSTILHQAVYLPKYLAKVVFYKDFRKWEWERGIDIQKLAQDKVLQSSFHLIMALLQNSNVDIKAMNKDKDNQDKGTAFKQFISQFFITEKILYMDGKEKTAYKKFKNKFWGDKNIKNKIDEIMAAFLKRGANPNTKVKIDHKEYSLLHLAIKQGRQALALKLIKNDKTKINVTDDEKNTPLHLAVTQRSVEIVRALTKRDDLKINLENSEKHTALSLAGLHNRNISKQQLNNDTMTILNLLIDKNAKGDLSLHLKYHFTTGNEALAKFLIEKGAKTDFVKDEPPLVLFGVLSKDESTLPFLLRHDAPADLYSVYKYSRPKDGTNWKQVWHRTTIPVVEFLLQERKRQELNTVTNNNILLNQLVDMFQEAAYSKRILDVLQADVEPKVGDEARKFKRLLALHLEDLENFSQFNCGRKIAHEEGSTSFCLIDYPASDISLLDIYLDQILEHEDIYDKAAMNSIPKSIIEKMLAKNIQFHDDYLEIFENKAKEKIDVTNLYQDIYIILKKNQEKTIVFGLVNLMLTNELYFFRNRNKVFSL